MRTSTEVVDVNFMCSHWYYLIEILVNNENARIGSGCRWKVEWKATGNCETNTVNVHNNLLTHSGGICP